MNLDVRVVGSNGVHEVFITATPTPELSPVDQAGELFSGIRDVLHRTGARIFQERVFGTPSALAILRKVRSNEYGTLIDGVDPSWLVVPAGVWGAVAGVQVHGVCSPYSPAIVSLNGEKYGRYLKNGNAGWMSVIGITASEAGDERAALSRVMLEKMEGVLKQAGGDLFSVARTWMWLGDVLSWYDEFNRIRTGYFAEKGLFNGQKDIRLPASTGIGIGPWNGAKCALDAMAVIHPRGAIEYFLKGGDQDSALAYGSAFSRASRAPSPGGQTVYVSGTAAIDKKGATEDVGYVSGQIEKTIAYVRRVLADTGCGDSDVVHAIFYSKTPEVERTFYREREKLSWPAVMCVADVCRADLLVEIEVTACPGARSMSK